MTITTDARGRAHLGTRDQSYKVTHLEGGALLLEPATVYTDAELAVLATPDVLRQVRENAGNGRPGRPFRAHR